ncbi:DUF7509 family protein [Halorhabdus rudnickae]|uniref:DUF7509 family protein n=1 Tax=Halorhabdus rudnickae TaxID=1775544 RepID=UPI001082F536|nr:hypothetical protein [Halorhabdus rudnickae]
MNSRNYGFTFESESVFSRIQQDVPQPDSSKLEDDFYVFVMGPYTAFDATYAYSDGDQLQSPFINDPLFEPESHITADERGSFKLALEDLCQAYRDRFGVHAFLATDVTIPTDAEASDDEEAMSVLDQSVAFAAVSDAVVFVFSDAGLTTGVGAEVGTILGEFHLRRGNQEPVRKPRERFRIFKTEGFSSASIDEIPSTFKIDTIEFETRADLVNKTQQFLSNIERNDPDRPLPVFTPYSSEDSN